MASSNLALCADLRGLGTGRRLGGEGGREFEFVITEGTRRGPGRAR